MEPKNLKDLQKQIEELLNIIEKDLITMKATTDKKIQLKN